MTCEKKKQLCYSNVLWKSQILFQDKEPRPLEIENIFKSQLHMYHCTRFANRTKLEFFDNASSCGVQSILM